jgi:hypothetical protein
MKKKILSIVAIAALSTGAFASANVQIGGSSNNLDSGTTKGGVYLGMDGMKDVKQGFLVGAGFNINMFRLKRTQTSGGYILTTSGGAYTMAVDALVGYTFKDKFDIPLTLKAGLGYGVTRDNIVKQNSWAAQYSASAVYTIYKGVGLGVRYSTTNTQLLNTDVKIKSSIAYLNIAY